jgi:hypothetical protein
MFSFLFCLSGRSRKRVQSYAFYFYRASILTIIFSRFLRTFGAFGAIALNDSRLAENKKIENILGKKYATSGRRKSHIYLITNQ